MKYILLIPLMLLTALPETSAQEASRDCERGLYLDDFHETRVDCPSVELALRIIKENPLAYRIGQPDMNGIYLWHNPEMAISILRQEYAPTMVFSKREQDALANELAQLYMYGTREQSFLARSALRHAAVEDDAYSGIPYSRSLDLFIEIFETLISEYPDSLECSITCPESVSRAQIILEKIRVSGGQKGLEYHNKVWEPIRIRRQEATKRARQ